MGRHHNRAWEGYTANVNATFKTEGLAELQKKLDALLTTDPEMEKRIKKIIRKALEAARKRMGEEFIKVMDTDPRKAYKAVRKTVYRRILGGNINILNSKRRGSASNYEPTRTLKSGQRGGNRRPRSERTMRMEGYEGEDRGFILRFLNAGAKAGGGRRQLRSFTKDPHRARVNRGSRGGDLSRYGNLGTVNTGNRGSIKAMNIFGRASDLALNQIAMRAIEEEVDKLIQGEFKK